MIAAVVVLYNPDVSVLRNVISYINHVEKVFIIDNSEFSNKSLFHGLEFDYKLEYVFNNSNVGIAQALNTGCRLASEGGFTWVLTMDQDSGFFNLDEDIKKSILDCSDNKIALFYPNYLIKGVVYNKYIKEDNIPIIVMTSGNFIKLDIYNKLEGFEDKLFIDYVDIDYCLKLRSKGYKIAHLPELNLLHELGQSKQISFLGFKVMVTNHSSLRRYYITRNRLYVSNKYKNVSKVFNKLEKKVFVNDIIKILFFEKNKILKLKSIIRGYIDYRNNKYGVYSK